MRSAAWSSDDARWTVTATRTADDGTGHEVTYTCSFLFMCAGYYSYRGGYTPEFPGSDRFGGRIVHPQDARAVEDALLDLYTRWRKGDVLVGPDRDGVRFYHRGHQATRMATHISAVAATWGDEPVPSANRDMKGHTPDSMERA